MRGNVVFCSLVLILVVVCEGDISKEVSRLHERQKRFLLVWPEGFSRVTSIAGFGLPVDLKDETVIIGTVLKANYRVPINSSIYTNPNVVYARKNKRSITRWDVYGLLAEAAQLHGFGGKACILRAICEIADVGLDRRGGLMHELVHAIFTPTTTTDTLNHHSDNEYYAAQEMGKAAFGRCGRFFPDCNGSFMEMFSKII